MKQRLNKDDKLAIIRGLKQGIFNVTELNHLVKDVADHSGEIEIFGAVTLQLSAADKRQLLAALNTGWLDIEKMPDLYEELKENYFLKVMKRASDLQ